jgi:hydroxypyruvate reductase
MMAVPAEGLTLGDKQETTSQLLRAGGEIQALNAVRKHLSAIKGGHLGVAAAESLTLAVSDVVGDDVSTIGSGPTVPDATTFRDALEILRRYGGADRYPNRVVDRLKRGADGLVPETPKPGDARLARAAVHVIGNRATAMHGAASAARDLGYNVGQLDDAVTGEAREAAPRWLERVLAHASVMPRPVCILSSGEMTVHVKGSGHGGRNQEFALALVELLAARNEGPAASSSADISASIVVASIGTDGVDGPTDAAGALVDSETLARARRAGLSHPQSFLDHNNSYEFFAPLGDLVLTGPTGTNVGDLQILLLV